MRATFRLPVLLAVAGFVAAAGCTATGASSGNFELTPDRIGWYVGETASFTLNITPSLTRQAPDYLLDRHFAIEEIRYDEKGAKLGGDYKTRNPDDVSLTLWQGNATGTEFTLDEENPTVRITLDVPEKLRDSEYVLELELFNVGWVKSAPFRVDER